VCASGRRLRCKASATVQLVCSGWKCRHDTLVMWLLLRQDATDEGVGWRGGGSLDLKCDCCNALMDEALRVVSSLACLRSHPSTSGALQGGGRADARRALACPHTYNAPKPVGAENLAHHLQIRADATVRCAELHVAWSGRGAPFRNAEFSRSFR
jgi:hypothetical protein